MKNKIRLMKRNGFSILAVILVIVAAIVAIGIWSLSGQRRISNDNNIDVQVSALINDSIAIQAAYDNLLIRNGVGSTSITFLPNTASTVAAPNILDPVTGIQVPKVNRSIIRDGTITSVEGIWVFTHLISQPPGVGSSSELFPIARTEGLMIAGIKDSVCKHINYKVNNYTGTTPNRNEGTTGSVSLYFGGTTVAKPLSAAVTPIVNGSMSAIAGWTSGCVKINPGVADNGVYFKILQIK